MTELQLRYGRELALCEERAARFGLTLSAAEHAMLAAERERVLRDTGRVEFGGGILPQLLDAFCDAPGIRQEDLAETLAALQEIFYNLKEQAGDLTPDRSILRLMRRVFDLREDAAFLEGFSIGELQAFIKEARERGFGEDR